MQLGVPQLGRISSAAVNALLGLMPTKSTAFQARTFAWRRLFGASAPITVNQVSAANSNTTFESDNLASHLVLLCSRLSSLSDDRK